MKNYFMLLLLFLVATTTPIFAQNTNTRITNKAGFPKFEILNEFRAESEATTLLQEKLDLSQDESFTPVKQFMDELGFRHTKYTQHYKGLSVAFASYIVHAKEKI